MRKTGTVGLLLALALLGGCAGSGGQEDAALQGEPEKLVLWAYYETQAQRDGLDRLIQDFNQSQTAYEASWEYIPMTGFVKELSTAYTENELPDLAILDNPDMPALIQMGLFEDITEQVQTWGLPGECFPSIMETLESGGDYYGIPFNCNSTALIYNEDLLREKGVEIPGTWEELREAAGRLTGEEQYGFALCGIASEQGAFQILSWILAAGEDPRELGGEATVKALSFLKSLLEDGSLSGNCINLTQTDLALEFTEGRAAMMQNGPWVLPMLEESGISYGIVPIPGEAGGAAVVGGENIGILKGKNVQGALAFLDFCMQEGELTAFCRQASVLPADCQDAREMAEEDRQMKVFERQMEGAVTRSAIPGWPSISRKLTDGFHMLVSGEQTPQEIADDIRNMD